MWFDGRRYTAGNLILNGKNLTGSSVVTLGPLMHARSRIDQLRVDAHTLPRPAHAAFEDVADPELLRNLLHVDGPVFVGKCRVAGNYEKPSDPGQFRDQILGNAVREVPLILI